MKRVLKRFLLGSPIGILAFNYIRVVRETFARCRLDDLTYIRGTYRERFGREIDLVEPRSFTEKLQWLKLFHRDPRMPNCSDKFAVRDYVRNAGLGRLLNGIIGIYETSDQIDFDRLPEKFVVKATHGSGWNLVCTDKSRVDWRIWKRIFNSWRRLDLSVFGREWNYREITPRILVEEFIAIEPLIDYKFMCFNGEPRFIQINHDHAGKHFVDFYDIGWTKADMTYRRYIQSDFLLPKPVQIDEMINVARTLSVGFPFVRVDLYADDNTVIFGEMTFFPGGGLQPIIPSGSPYDEALGEWLALPEPNHNLEVLSDLAKDD